MRRQLEDGAARRKEELAIKERKRAADTHIRQLCVDVVGVLKDSSGGAAVGSKLIERYLTRLYDYLPEAIRPKSAEALVQQAKRVLISTERLKGGARSRHRKRQAASDAERDVSRFFSRYGKASTPGIRTAMVKLLVGGTIKRTANFKADLDAVYEVAMNRYGY
jgi:hypothetical protein